MKQYTLKGPILLFITALLWGTTFVAQALGGDYVGAFTYNTFRYLIAGVVLLAISYIRKFYYKKKEKEFSFVHNVTKKMNYTVIILLTIGVGVALFLGGAFQQLGITMTKSSGKTGFIASLYIVFVPVLGLMFGRKFNPVIFIFIIIALLGSFLISFDNEMHFELGDILTLICAVFFAFQIVFIDVVNPHMDPIFLTGLECLIAGILSLVCALLFESTSIDNVIKAMPAILYAAILSSCIAYTLQVFGQKYTKPSVAPLIMSLESVFALISGLIVLHESMPIQGYVGCALIFLAIIGAQLDYKSLFSK